MYLKRYISITLWIEDKIQKYYEYKYKKTQKYSNKTQIITKLSYISIQTEKNETKTVKLMYLLLISEDTLCI